MRALLTARQRPFPHRRTARTVMEVGRGTKVYLLLAKTRFLNDGGSLTPSEPPNLSLY